MDILSNRVLYQIRYLYILCLFSICSQSQARDEDALSQMIPVLNIICGSSIDKPPSLKFVDNDGMSAALEKNRDTINYVDPFGFYSLADDCIYINKEKLRINPIARTVEEIPLVFDLLVFHELVHKWQFSILTGIDNNQAARIRNAAIIEGQAVWATSVYAEMKGLKSLSDHIFSSYESSAESDLGNTSFKNIGFYLDIPFYYSNGANFINTVLNRFPNNAMTTEEKLLFLLGTNGPSLKEIIYPDLYNFTNSENTCISILDKLHKKYEIKNITEKNINILAIRRMLLRSHLMLPKSIVDQCLRRFLCAKKYESSEDRFLGAAIFYFASENAAKILFRQSARDYLYNSFEEIWSGRVENTDHHVFRNSKQNMIIFITQKDGVVLEVRERITQNKETESMKYIETFIGQLLP